MFKKKRSKGIKKNIFIGFGDVAGYYQLLSLGLKEQNYNVTTISEDIGPQVPKYFYETPNTILIKLFTFTQNKINSRHNFLIFWVLANKLIRNVLFFWAVRKHEVFIFSQGRSFSTLSLDLAILRLLKKTIISCVFHGSESRPLYVNGVYIDDTDNANSIFNYIKIKKIQITKYKIKIIENFSNFVIGSPTTCQFNSKKIINYFKFGIPIFDKSKVATSFQQNNSKQVRILHAPSKIRAKGTLLIRKAIQNLKKQGYKIIYIECHGMSQVQVIEEIKKCDFVVDQCFADVFLAGFGSEAATYGKPTVIAGYYFNKLSAFFNQDEIIPPVHCVYPEQIELGIKYLINNVEYRKHLGLKAKNFVDSCCSYKKLTEKYVMIINNKLPESFFINPLEIRNVFSAGLSKKRLQQSIKNIISIAGTKGLMLSHNPGLEKKFIEFTKINLDDWPVN